MADSIIVLIESADRCMDHEDWPMKDWEFIQSYILSESALNWLNSLSSIPIIGTWIKKLYLFEQYSLSYDILINFLEAHEETCHLLQKVITN